MRTFTLTHCMGATVAAFFSFAALANPPGEDPLILQNKVVVQMLPIGGKPTSNGLDKTGDMPTWLRARVARYEARAYSADTGEMVTDSDVQTSATSQGFQKTCVQEIGSASPPAAGFNRYGPSDNTQIVVLRGDLVNVCR